MEDTGLLIQYGIIDGYDSVETVHLTYFDTNPLELRYYMFGSYDAKVNIYDISVTEMSADQEAKLRCFKKPFDKLRCSLICHNNCLGCFKANSSSSCNECRFSGYQKDGQTNCLDSCPRGYEKNRSLNICQDIDECSRIEGAVVYRTKYRDEVYKWHSCSSQMGSKCVNEPGGFRCECLPGFSGSVGNCTDVDECEDMKCNGGKECRNLVGGFRCECGHGFTEIDGLCVDVDECVKGMDECQVNSHCVNRVGSYKCECDEGFSGNGLFCKGK